MKARTHSRPSFPRRREPSETNVLDPRLRGDDGLPGNA